MAGRPIAASHSYITRPISIFVDEFIVKPSLAMPTVLRDSGKLIQCLETTYSCLSYLLFFKIKLLSCHGECVITLPEHWHKAIIALDLFLREAKMTQTPLLAQFTRLILENNFVKSEFSADIYHQNSGIAMGTPFAVTAANAFMYYHERDIVGTFSRYLPLSAFHRRHICYLGWLSWDPSRISACY